MQDGEIGREKGSSADLAHMIGEKKEDKVDGRIRKCRMRREDEKRFFF
jgi:hypothetical protein